MDNSNENPPIKGEPISGLIYATLLVLVVLGALVVFWPRSADKTTPEITDTKTSIASDRYGSLDLASDFEWHDNHAGIPHSEVSESEQNECRTNQIVYLLAQLQRDQKVLNHKVQSFNSSMLDGGLTDE